MFFRAALASVALILAMGAVHAGPVADSADLVKVVKSLKGITVDESTQFSQTPDLYYRFIGAPKGVEFRGTRAAKAADPESIARAYLAEHGGAFGAKSLKLGFKTDRVRSANGFSYVRFDQTYGGVPVFGAQVNVQVNGQGGIQSVLSDIMRDTDALDSGRISTVPAISAADAGQKAIVYATTLYPGVTLELSGEPELNVYHPEVIGNTGGTALVWICTVASPDRLDIKESVFINAHNGQAIFHYSLIEQALFRRVFDAFQSFTDEGILRRQEGQGPTGIADVDSAYDFLGDTYDFYFNEHGRDSIDGGGLTLHAIVRLPFANAFWNGSQMLFGNGWVADDVTAHELTHGVTQFSSDLIYYRESGAINEAFSDIWGEFIDLVNGKGNDDDSVRWLVAEDLPSGAIRNMKNPEAFGDPDRYSLWNEVGLFDNGGVHINSGIGNKLAYLLTDGTPKDPQNGTDIPFNGRVIQPLGIPKAAKLFYEAQTNLLTKASSYYDLGLLLVHSAYNLDFTLDEVRNVEEAVQAVEIMPADAFRPIRWLRATSFQGESVVHLNWQNAHSRADNAVTIVRRDDRFPEDPADGDVLASNIKADRYDDTTVVAGQQYYYGVFSKFGTQTAPSTWEDVSDFAQVVAGEGQQDYLSQTFSAGGPTPFDLAFTQFTFDPVIDQTEAFASGKSEHFANYNNYALTVQKDVFTLPVDNSNAGYLTLRDDGFVYFSLRAPIPFFGKMMNVGALSANGYITNFDDLRNAEAQSSTGYFNFPSVESHFELPRIAFLFSDLSPHSGGVVWFKDLEDRYVFTFERVPEFGSFRNNTAQVELFYSGRIRITLLEINAQNVVVGLSDGNGVPIDPITRRVKQSDLSEKPAPAVLTQDTVPPIFVQENEPVQFTVQANVPGGQTPAFSFGRVGSTGLLDPLPEGASFTPEGGQTATAEFNWTPSFQQAGYYAFRTIFTVGGQSVSQDIQVVVGDNIRLPQMEPDEQGIPRMPLVRPDAPRDSDPLRAEYHYFQADGVPEGQTSVYWYRNNVYLPTFTNQRIVPANATSIGDRWHFVVVPRTLSGLEGVPTMSNIVTIQEDLQPDVNKDGKTDAEDLQSVINGFLEVGEVSPAQDINGDGAIDAIDVQMVVNIILESL